ncbi:uncharacterized protein PV09_01400 [Verruconis gallopava]|uniref:EXPERA domain-containing protein n=1 Tax=Verruconis gallopava TaxID=253628 RepID=A0A0D1Y0G0_9PEZI|nr:uncharacterized protein PV09_01400 [Verruconis gallopava]KIW08506.1 hypothetical protein PV09_01400 [Verruconis gallopava]
MARFLPVGQILLTLPALQIMIAAYFTDVLGTHVCNPDWPGHARYHNAQTMDLMIFLEIMTLYFTWRSPFLRGSTEKRESLFVAALIGSTFFVTGMLAPYFPGRLCLDKGVPPGEPGTPGNLIYGVPLVLNWIGYRVAIGRTQQSEHQE